MHNLPNALRRAGQFSAAVITGDHTPHTTTSIFRAGPTAEGAPAHDTKSDAAERLGAAGLAHMADFLDLDYDLTLGATLQNPGDRAQGAE